MAVSNRLRFEILRRDQFRCVYCGAAAKDGSVLEIDHVLPRVLGGSDKPDNLVAACADCNSGKTSIHPDSPFVDGIEEDALRWARTVRLAGQKMIADRGALEDLLREFKTRWDRWGYGEGDDRVRVPIGAGWEKTVTGFLADGLPMPVLLDCIEEAMDASQLPAKALWPKVQHLASAKLAQLRRSADAVVRDGEDEPDFAVLCVPAFAESLLDHLDDDEREAAVAKTREEYGNNIEMHTAETVFGDLVIDRWRLHESIERILHLYPEDEVAEARKRAVDELIRYTGEAPERDVAAHAAEFITAYYDARRYLDSLPQAEGGAWIAYVEAWPDKENGRQAITIRAADLARRKAHGEPSSLVGMCIAPDQDSPIGRCGTAATHTVWVDECGYCERAGRQECDGQHQVCEPHLGDLIDGEIVGSVSGEPIKICDFAELAVSA